MRIAILSAIVFAIAGAALAQGRADSGRLPPADPDCIRSNTPQAVLDAVAAAAPDTKAMQQALFADTAVALAVAHACHLPATAKGGERLGAVEGAIGMETWSAAQLSGRFRVDPVQLGLAWEQTPLASREAFALIPASKDPPAPAVLSDLQHLMTALNLSGQDAASVLSTYAMSRSYIDRVSAGLE